MNPQPFSDADLLSKFEEYLIRLNTDSHEKNRETTIIEYNQITDEILNRKWIVKKVEK